MASANSISITRFSGSIFPQRRMPTMVGRSSTSAWPLWCTARGVQELFKPATPCSFSQLAELLLSRHLEGLPHSSDQRHLVHRPLAPATPCFIQRIQVFANGQRCNDINHYGRTVAVHDLLKGREHNQNKAVEGFDGAVQALSLEGVSQMAYILPERLPALVRPAFDLVLRRIRSLKRCVQA